MKSIILTLCVLVTLSVVSGCSDNPTAATDSSVDSYFPTTLNSTWSYQGTALQGPVSYSLTIVGDTVISGRHYARAVNSSSGAGLIRRDGSTYYQIVPNSNDEQPVLKTDGIGATWSYEVSVSGNANFYEYTLTATGLEKTVNGTLFKDVLQVHSKASLKNPFGGGWQVYNEGNVYYAKNVGLIEADYGSFGKVSLVSYSIK